MAGFFFWCAARSIPWRTDGHGSRPGLVVQQDRILDGQVDLHLVPRGSHLNADTLLGQQGVDQAQPRAETNGVRVEFSLTEQSTAYQMSVRRFVLFPGNSP